MEKPQTAKSATAIQAVRGMNDVLPADSPKWEFFEETVTRVARRFAKKAAAAPALAE